MLTKICKQPKGPGQLTVYPIIDLRSYNQDIHWYMRALEEAILLSLKSIGINDVSKSMMCIQMLLFI